MPPDRNSLLQLLAALAQRGGGNIPQGLPMGMPGPMPGPMPGAPPMGGGRPQMPPEVMMALQRILSQRRPGGMPMGGPPAGPMPGAPPMGGIHPNLMPWQGQPTGPWQPMPPGMRTPNAMPPAAAQRRY